MRDRKMIHECRRISLPLTTHAIERSSNRRHGKALAVWDFNRSARSSCRRAIIVFEQPAEPFSADDLSFRWRIMIVFERLIVFALVWPLGVVERNELIDDSELAELL